MPTTQATPTPQSPASRIKVGYALIPIVIGIGVIGWMLYREFNPLAFKQISFTWHSVLWLFVALLFMAGRDIGYTFRLITLSGGKLTFLKSLKVIMLWEFTSAITPSAIGGTSVAIVYVNKEGLNVGESSAVVMATSFLDELYFLLAFPLILLLIGSGKLFGLESEGGLLVHELKIICWAGYTVKALWTLLMAYGLFVNPKGVKWLIMNVFRLPLLRRWKKGAEKAGNDIISSSAEFKRKPLTFWLKAFLSSVLSWSSRFFVVNALLVAFFSVSDHLIIFGRQLIMWIMMLVSPTPGGSGFAEFVFTRYLSEFIPVEAASLGAIAVALALLWRLISYYPYLFVGAILFPRWIKQKFVDKKPAHLVQKDETQGEEK